MTAKLLLGLLAATALAVAAALAAIVKNRVPLLDPPGLGVRLATYLTSNVVRTHDDPDFPERRPIRVALEPDAARARVAALVRALGWTLSTQVPDPLEVRAVVRSPWLGFEDDVRIRIEAEGPGASRLEVRSASRVGRGDLGANTRHLMDLREAIDRAGLALER